MAIQKIQVVSLEKTKISCGVTDNMLNMLGKVFSVDTRYNPILINGYYFDERDVTTSINITQKEKSFMFDINDLIE